VGKDRTVGVERQEVKYSVDAELAEQVTALTAGFVEPDSHAAGGHYTIASLYLDDDRFSAARESSEGVKDRCKLRLRCYSFEPNAPVWAEVKRRSGTTVLKSRARISRAVAHALCRGDIVDPGMSLDPEAFEEFLYEQQIRQMSPKVWIRYQRTAFTSAFGDDARLTLDRYIEAQECHEPAYTIRDGEWRGIEVDPEYVLELKYDLSYPAWMQVLVRTVDIQRRSLSKYGRGAALFTDDPAALSWSQVWTVI
jgi:hypothetical protein